MVEDNPDSLKTTKFSITKELYPILILGGLFGLAFGGIFILIVPLSFLFWPNDPYHPLEMGLLISALFGTSAISGLILGRIIDNHKFSRRNILLLIALVRGFCMIIMGLAISGLGYTTWIYFLILIIIFAFFAGGAWPAILSLSNDIIPKDQRSEFFGVMGIIGGLFFSFGFLVAAFLFQIGLWRAFFIGIGISIVLAGVLFCIKIEEPKRGAKEKELSEVLKDDSIVYDFQIDLEMIKKTMLNRTNRIALVEGIFSNILMGALTVLVLPYLQTPPHNISPLATSVFIILFGLTGGIIGQMSLAKYSDKKAKTNPVLRIHFIILSLTIGTLTFALFFFLPLPYNTAEEGRNIPLLMSHPMMWIMGALYFTSSIISSLYPINQMPLLQDINLPEAVGQIVSWNQFIESIGHAIGPIIIGYLLIITDFNYQYTVLITVLLIIPGISFWFFALKTYPEDTAFIKKILGERSKILEARKNGNISN